MKKHKISQNFITACRHSIHESDVIAILHDISNRYTRNALHPIILHFLKDFKKKKSFLILNKIDKIRSKRALLDTIRSLTCGNIGLDPNFQMKRTQTQNNIEDEVGWPHFERIFLVSSLQGDGVDDVVEYMSLISQEKSWEYRNNESTDQNPESLVIGFVRARLLDYLPQEIPYNLKVDLEFFSNDENKIVASVLISCPNERHERLLCGTADGKLRQITDRVTSDLIESFHLPVTLTICTKSRAKKD